MQTVDFFTPVVDDPYLYGQIAAANALSDVYAMGGRPLTALNILCFPLDTREPAEAAAILQGGAERIALAGAVLAGGHSVEDAEPKYGMAVTGLVHPERFATNAGAQPGDILLLTKPLGSGILTTAARADACPADAFTAAADCMKALNRPASEVIQALGAGRGEPVRAATDITGFGVLGHLWQLARASRVRVRLHCGNMPLLPEALALAAAGHTTGGALRNLAYAEAHMKLETPAARTWMPVLTDPQTSGGIAMCVARHRVKEAVERLMEAGAMCAAVIGEVEEANETGLVID